MDILKNGFTIEKSIKNTIRKHQNIKSKFGDKRLISWWTVTNTNFQCGCLQFLSWLPTWYETLFRCLLLWATHRGYVPVALENCAGVSRSSPRFGFHSVVPCLLPRLGGISWLSQSGVQSLAVFKPDAMLATAVAGLITCTAWWRPTLCLFAESALSDVEFSLQLWHMWLLQFARVIQLVSSTLC